MNFKISIDQGSNAPIYKQVVSQIENSIKDGFFEPGDIIPSMNDLSQGAGISKETVKKAYSFLRDKGLIEPKQGKGFYVATNQPEAGPSVLVLFDKLSVYKQVLFNSLSETLGEKAETTILTHHQNLEIFEYYLTNYLDKYDYYVVSPHFPLDPKSQKKALKLLGKIPNRKLIMIDNWVRELPGNYGAVYQDFENDAYYGLSQGGAKLKKAGRICVITLPTSMYGTQIASSIKRYGIENNLSVEFFNAPPADIREKDVFIIVNSQLDWGLAELSRQIKDAELKIGKDVGIISYNEFSLNEVVLGGLTTISTDFDQMGKLAAQMILDKKLSKIHCDFKMIRRNTF